MATTEEGEERVLAAAQQIMKSLNSTCTNDDMAKDMLHILSSFGNRFSSLSNPPPVVAAADDDSFPVHRFDAAEHVIVNGDGSSSTVDYLAAVDELVQLTESFNVPSEYMDRAESAIQLAMAHLEDDFRLILSNNAVAFCSERLNQLLTEDQEDVLTSEKENHVSGTSLGGDDCEIDLIVSDAIVELREIADRMIRSGYEKECCQVYSSVRREVLSECLADLGVEKLSIEDLQRIEWRSLDEKMKKWIFGVKFMVRVLLPAEKRLCDQIFDCSDLIKDVCFIETAKGCVLQLLNFGEAVAIGRRSSEKLFRILDMYDAFAGILPDLNVLFSDEAGEIVSSDAKEALDGLGLAIIGTFVEFENAVQGESSRKPTQGGEIHQLTRYVMNYVKLLVDYSDTLNALLKNVDSEHESVSSHLNESDNPELEKDTPPLARRLISLIKSLEAKLEEKSRMYEDSGMNYVFLMNNLLYMVQKVKDSELKKLLGDQWIRKRRGQIRQYATSYLRSSWSKVLSCLKDEGLGGSSNNASKVALKERFKNFNACFEEIYRTQTSWKVPDAQLREELRISISEKVLPAYRSFMGRFGSQVDSGRNAGKYVKYTLEDLENYLLDLFEGTPLVLHHIRRKSY